MMSTTAEKSATTPIPVQLSEPEFTAFILPHLSMPKRGPKCKLGYHRVFNLILWVLYTGMQWKGLPVPKDTNGQPAIHYTTVYKVFAKWADDGSLQQAFMASVAHLSDEKQLDLRVLHGDGTNTVAKKGAMASATRATSTRRGKRSSPSRTTMAMCWLPSPSRPCNETDMVLLPEGLQAVKQVAKEVGLDLRGAYLNLDGGFDSARNRKMHFQCRDDSQHHRKSAQPQNHQARSQAVIQCSDPCVTRASRADLCVGG